MNKIPPEPTAPDAEALSPAGQDSASHAGHRERLRLRYQQEGLGGFAPHEILEMLLTYAIPRVDVNPIAHRLLQHFGTLPAVLEADMQELQQVEGIGAAAAVLISSLVPMFRRYEQEKRLPRLNLNNYEQLTGYCRSLFLGAREEKCFCLCLDSHQQLLAAEEMASGTPSEVSVSPRTVVSALLRHNAVGAVLTHNHPGLLCQPSQEDVDLTLRIAALLGGMGITLYDHVIVAGEKACSLVRDGYIARPRADAAAEAAESVLPPIPGRRRS